jgi:hypothetical protein
MARRVVESLPTQQKDLTEAIAVRAATSQTGSAGRLRSTADRSFHSALFEETLGSVKRLVLLLDENPVCFDKS